MGQYETRMIPLAPGKYDLRLSDAASDAARSVEIKVGWRTRLIAFAKAPD
jgi:hypothetical protein